MGTRSIIKIDGVRYAKIYKHWDGNPNHMLPWLEQFNKDFAENRGDDPPYKFAQLLRRTADPTYTETFNLGDSLYTGWGVIDWSQKHCDQAYEYTLRRDGTVTWEAV